MNEALTREERKQLLTAARRSIESGLHQSQPLEMDAAHYPAPLQQQRATFVTLHTRFGDLRGCIGTLEPRRPLISDVVHNAFSAAFRDPRFPPLSEAQYSGLVMEVSVLSLPEPIDASSEEELLRQLRPGVDGLIIESGRHRATFLPSVWESLPQPREFLSALKRKAGLTADTPTLLTSFRYTTERFSSE